MKGGFLVIVILSLAIVSQAQNLNSYEAATDTHVLIRGTNISMIPPKTYVLSEEFKGFHNPADQTSMIMIMELPIPYQETSTGFTREELIDKGMVLTSKNAYRVNGYDGSLIELIQVANSLTFAKWILIYGDSAMTMMINGVYLKDSIRLGEGIKQSIMSTVVNTRLVIDPRGDLDYNLRESEGSLQFHSVVGNAMLFSRDGIIPTESPERIILATDKSFAKVDIQDKKEFCIERVKSYPYDFQIIQERGVNEIELDGLKGYGLYALKGVGDEKEMYQAIVFNDSGGYYAFIGTYLIGDENAKTDILSIIDTFRRD
ncbi:MAG: hypothetical protein DRI69_04575 [Bacteroidetes bacterium]|nr:MAG: hypothetical protein DRI69_04575 [Bacteroidota bacterium]